MNVHRENQRVTGIAMFPTRPVLTWDWLVKYVNIYQVMLTKTLFCVEVVTDGRGYWPFACDSIENHHGPLGHDGHQNNLRARQLL